jgi:FkbM family methyltransferase
MLDDLLNIVHLIGNHPLGRSQKFSCYRRLLQWQIASRIWNYPFVFPFVNETRFIVERGMTGATGNIYVGLMEFSEMAFALHLLRKGDWFGDVGANVGIYTILASAVRGAHTLAVEPSPKAAKRFADNITINKVTHLVDLCQCGSSSSEGFLTFTSELDTQNHVASDHDSTLNTMKVRVDTLDNIFITRAPTLLKIDVEGFETEVLAGARRLLGDPALKAIIIELNGSGARYGYDDQKIHQMLIDRGFETFSYAVRERQLQPTDSFGSANAIYVRDREFVVERVSTASPFSVLGQTF